jgi:hypothetical protein
MLRKTRIFSSIIFFISFTDMMGSIGVIFGMPNSGTPWCTAQALLYLFFFPASWVWTALLIFQLRCVFRYQKMWLRFKYMHMIVWLTASFSAFAPLTTNGYGQDDELNSHVACNLSGNSRDGYIWGIATTSIILLACVASMAYNVIEIRFLNGKNGVAATAKQIGLYNGTKSYPVAMIICWVPYLALGMLQDPADVVIGTVFYVFCCLTVLYGPALAVIFFLHSKEARQAWIRLFDSCGKGDTTMENIRTSLLYINNSIEDDSEENWGFSDDDSAADKSEGRHSTDIRDSELQMVQ